MSLIDEALKRARHEAARQEAAKRDVARHEGPRPVPALYAEGRRRSRAPLVAGIASGAAVALLGLLAWTLSTRSPQRGPASSPASASSSRAPAPGPSTSSPRTSAPAREARVDPRSPVANDHAPTPSAVAPPAASGDAGRASAPSVAPAEPASPIPAAAPAPSAPVASAPSGRNAPAAPSAPVAAATAAPSGQLFVYVREGSLPGGGPRFRLGGIAYSDEAPVALINGNAIGRGEVVEGYVVRRIEAAEVELEGAAGRVVLRLK